MRKAIYLAAAGAFALAGCATKYATRMTRTTVFAKTVSLLPWIYSLG